MVPETRETTAGPESRSARRQVPLRPGIFRLPDRPGDKAALIGSRCPDCDSYFFPKRENCLNCGRRGLDETELSSRGKVWTYTIAHQVPPGAVVGLSGGIDSAVTGSLIEAPYAIAQVQLPEKVMVQTVLTGCDPESVHVGMDVELVIEKVKEDDNGNDVVAFKFGPAPA